MPAGPPTDDNVIGLNVGQSGGNVWGNEEYICQQFVKLAQIAAKAGYHLRWFVVWPKDLSVTQQVVRNSAVHSDICEVYQDYEKYLDMVSRTKIFVGMKLHAVALATCAYVPSIMLEYNPKCRDYMDSIGQGQNTLRTDRFTAHQVWELVNHLLAKRPSVAKCLFETITEFRKLQSSRASQISINLGLNRVSD
jgi:polysaccharide pyruvyl transferase WcaK-like protein